MNHTYGQTGIEVKWACIRYMKFEILAAAKMPMLVFWFVNLKMEAVCSSEKLVSTYKSTRRYNPEGQH
jgi:hypothetical protein